MGVRGRQVVVDVFPEGIAEFRQQKSVRSLVWEEVQRGSPGGSMGLPYITPKGLSSRGFPGKALYFEENNRQKFSPIQMYLEG